jgi:CheY-like chemotaxis protein
MTNFSPKNTGSSCTVPARTSLLHRPLVLVVEDHEDTRVLLRVILEKWGICVVEAEDGEAGIQAANEHHPDLILMDWSLPLLDGLAVTRMLREHTELDHIPIIFLSAHAAPSSQKKAREAGCCEYLVKPLDFDQLDRVLRTHLSLDMIVVASEWNPVPKRGAL